ncbi:hypothetical protein BKL65_14000 [Staphylococcus aureus]|nr:hypothetical protein BKL65_14000 [Staphylococcus aureus]
MTERKCACNKLFSILVRGPNTEADEKSAYNNVQVGDGPQHRKFILLNFTFMCKLGKVSYFSKYLKVKLHVNT